VGKDVFVESDTLRSGKLIAFDELKLFEKVCCEATLEKKSRFSFIYLREGPNGDLNSISEMTKKRQVGSFVNSI